MLDPLSLLAGQEDWSVRSNSSARFSVIFLLTWHTFLHCVGVVFSVKWIKIILVIVLVPVRGLLRGPLLQCFLH